MSKTKKLSKVLAIVLALALLMSMSALAAWPTHQGDDNRDGRITDGAPTSAVPTTVIDSLQLPYNGASLMSGVDTEPIMRTENGVTYAYVIYNGGTISGSTGGARLAKIDCSSPNSSFLENNVYVPEKRIVWNVQLTPAAGFQLCTPVLVGNTLYLGANGLGQMLANNELAMENSDIPNWDITGGTECDGYVRVTGNQTVTLISDPVAITGGKSHRPAVGVRLGSSASTTVTATVTVSAIDSSNTETQLCSYPFSVNASEAEFRPIKNEINQDYYYYLNKNLTSAENANLTTGNYRIKFTVAIGGNDNGTVQIDYASFYQQGSYLYAATNLGLSSPSIQPLDGTGTMSGQMNTPLTYYSTGSGANLVEYLYFGTYTGSRSYYEYNITSGTLTAFTPKNGTTSIGNFYWAGATVVTAGGKNYVVFGSDAFTASGVKHTYLYYREVGSFNSTTSGGYYDLNTLGVTEAGNVRSTISKDSTYLYFTSQGPSTESYVWRVPIASIGGTLSSSNVDHLVLSGASSTSTPAISTKGRIYVGYYNGFSSGGVNVINQSSFTMLKNLSGIGPVQSSVIIYTSNNTDYLYFTTNSNSDYAYCYYYLNANNNGSGCRWSVLNSTYTLQGMAGCDGIVTYGNDADRFYLIK